MGARVTTAKAVGYYLVCVGLWVARPFAAQDAAALSGTVTMRRAESCLAPR